MVKVLIILNHPNYENSFANRNIMKNLITLIPDAEINHLDMEYPDEKINVKAEQEKLLKSDVVIFQFPIYWFKCPHLLGKWFEEVLVHGFAFGTNAYKLEGKKFILSFTMSGEKKEYKENYPVEGMVKSFEYSCKYVKMNFGGYVYTLDIPCNIKETPDIAKKKEEELKNHAEEVLKLINK